MKNIILLFIILSALQFLWLADFARASVDDGSLKGTPAVSSKSGSTEDDFETAASIDVRRLYVETQSWSHPVHQSTDNSPAPDVGQPRNSSKFQFKSGLQLQTGRQRVSQTGLLFSNNYNNARGADLSDSSGHYDLQLFGYQTQPSVSCDGLTVDYEPVRYNSGASLQLKNWDEWKIFSTYFASNSAQDVDVGDDATEAGTWDISANRDWLNKRLVTRLEYAHSTFADYQSRNASGRAIDTQIDFSSKDGVGFPLIENWSGGVHYRSVGREYYSMGDLDLPNGIDEANVFFESKIKSVALNLGLRQEKQQHLEALASIVKQERRKMVSLTYTPQFKDDNTFRQILGRPSITTHYHRIDQNEPEYESIDGVEPLFSEIDERGLKFEFAQRLWDWSIEYQQSDQHRQFIALGLNPAERMAPEWYKKSTFFRFGLNPDEEFSLKFNVQWHRQFEAGNTDADSQRLYNLKAHFDLIPNSCSLSMQYAYEDSLTSLYAGDEMETNVANQMGSAELSWRAINFNGSRPAVDLFFKSSYGRFSEYSPINVDERWSAQLSMKLYWGTQQL